MTGAEPSKTPATNVEFVQVNATLSESEYTAIHHDGATTCITAEDSRLAHDDYVDAAVDAVAKVHDNARELASGGARVTTTLQRYELTALQEVGRSVGSASFSSAVTTIVESEESVRDACGYEIDVYIHFDSFNAAEDAVDERPASAGKQVLSDLLDAAELEVDEDGTQYSLTALIIEDEVTELDEFAGDTDPENEQAAWDTRMAALLVDVATPIDSKDPITARV